MIDKLPPREREVLDALFARGEATAAELHAALDDPPSYSAVRSMLSRLERKGFVAHRVSEQRYIYSAALPGKKAAKTALRQVIQSFFRGSAVSAATALISMSDELSADELRQLREAIAKAPKERAK